VAAPLTETAIARIRDLILSGRFAPGAKLPAEHELAGELGLSRNTVREAVRGLATARVLDVRRGDGTYVTSLDPGLLLEGIGFAVELMRDDTWLELLEVRRCLEPAATALAASRIDEATLRALAGCLDKMRAAADDEELVRHDAEFHALVTGASGNRTMTSILTGLSNKTFRARVWRGHTDTQAVELTIRQHEDIYAALVARDATLAQAAATAHVAATESWFRRWRAGEEPTPTALAPQPASH
jgi:GntR family transcriptional regulator, transcriptional repressor for pyruvate dehydrogenase complex